jgi:hypothetical protein
VADVCGNCEANDHSSFRKLNIPIQPRSSETLCKATLASLLIHKKSRTTVETLTRKKCVVLDFDTM